MRLESKKTKKLPNNFSGIIIPLLLFACFLMSLKFERQSDECNCLQKIKTDNEKQINVTINPKEFKKCLSKNLNYNMQEVKVLEKAKTGSNFIYLIEFISKDTTYKSVFVFSKKHSFKYKFLTKRLYKTEISSRHAIYFGDLNYRIISDSTMLLLHTKHKPVKQDTLNKRFFSIDAPEYKVEEIMIKI